MNNKIKNISGYLPEQESRRKSLKDAVLIFGMSSRKSEMARLAYALKSRGCYNRVYIPSFDSACARYVPKIMQKFVACDHIAPLIRNEVAAGRLKRGFDIVGHSNGGYAAIHLLDELPKGMVRNIITISTPRGFWSLQPDYSRVENVVHIYGSRDFIGQLNNTALLASGFFTVSTGNVKHGYKLLGLASQLHREKFNPTSDAYFFRFPDEGHSSIHRDALDNGVADLIALVAGVSRSKLFMDDEGTVHIHDWCTREFRGKKYYSVKDLYMRHFNVCDGIHCAGMKSFPDDIMHNSYILGDILKLFETPAILKNLDIEDARVTKVLAKSKQKNLRLRKEVEKLICENRELKYQLSLIENGKLNNNKLLTA